MRAINFVIRERIYITIYHFTLCAQCTTIYSYQPTRSNKVEITSQDLNSIKRYARVYRDDCERKMRKIRRNFDKIQAQYIEMSSIDPDSGYVSPKDDLKHLKDCKAEATLMIKKIELMQSLNRD